MLTQILLSILRGNPGNERNIQINVAVIVVVTLPLPRIPFLLDHHQEDRNGIVIVDEYDEHMIVLVTRMKVAVVTAHMKIINRTDDIKEKDQRNTNDTDLMNEDIHVGSIQGKGNPREIKNEIGKVEEKKVNGDMEL